MNKYSRFLSNFILRGLVWLCIKYSCANFTSANICKATHWINNESYCSCHECNCFFLSKTAILKVPFEIYFPYERYDVYAMYSIHACHYSDVIMSAVASQIAVVSIVYWTVCSGAGQRKHQSFVSLAFVRVIYRSPVNSPHKGPVTRKNLSFDDVTK